jgi:hypothetical protein
MAVDNGASQFAFSANGSMIYLPGRSAPGLQQLALFDRRGNIEPLKLAPGSYGFPRGFARRPADRFSIERQPGRVDHLGL